MGGGVIGLTGAPLYGNMFKRNIFKLKDIRCQYHPLQKSLNLSQSLHGRYESIFMVHLVKIIDLSGIEQHCGGESEYLKFAAAQV